VAIPSSGLIVPLLRRFCDDATSFIRSTARDSLNARLVGTLYAGGVEKVGVDRYATKARSGGSWLSMPRRVSIFRPDHAAVLVTPPEKGRLEP